MNRIKHIMISDQLEAELRSGLFKEKLPSVRTLSARFEVSTRTMNKAIKTLSAKGLVIPSGVSGILINKNNNSRSKTGNVVIFCNRDNADVNHDELLHELSDIILSSGMRPVFMKAPHPDIFKDENFWKSGWVDGYIFVYSSFDRSFAHQLTRMNVPFVTANIVPEEYGVNWIDFDNDETDRMVFRKIAEYGYRRICYCAALRNPESHQKSVLKNINPIKREFMLDIDFCFLQNTYREMPNTSEMVHRQVRQTVKHMLEQSNKAEVVLTSFPPQFLKKRWILQESRMYLLLLFPLPSINMLLKRNFHA